MIDERPMPFMVDNGAGNVELTISTPTEIIMRIELDYDEMCQLFEVLVRALMHRIRQLS